MKKKIIWVLLIALIIAGVGGYFLYGSTKENKLLSVLNRDYTGIDKLLLRNGNSGKSAEITDINKVKEVIDYLNGITVKRKFFQPLSSGWTYNIKFCKKDKYIGDITFNYPLYINNKRYIITGKTNYDDVKKYIDILFKDKSLTWKE